MKQAATWPKHSILQMSKLGYQSMYFCSLATIVYCTRQSAFLLTLSHMASEVLFTIWQGGQMALPVRTTLAKV